MSINFTKVFCDCWNFIQNERKIILKFTALFFFFHFVLQFLIGQGQEVPVMSDMMSADFDLTQKTALFRDKIYQSLGLFFISIWGYITFHQLSQSRQVSLIYTFLLTVKRIWGVLLVNMIIYFPIILSIGFVFIKKTPSIWEILLLIVGMYFFVRMNLVGVHYAVTSFNIAKCFQTLWQQSKKRNDVLFIYWVLTYLFLPWLMNGLSMFSSNSVSNIIVSLILSSISIFSLVFTYRFYSLFMLQGEKV